MHVLFLGSEPASSPRTSQQRIPPSTPEFLLDLPGKEEDTAPGGRPEVPLQQQQNEEGAEGPPESYKKDSGYGSQGLLKVEKVNTAFA